MPTTKTQTRISASSNQTSIGGLGVQTLLSASISSSGIGTPIDGVESADFRITQTGDFRITQSGNFRIIN